MKTNKIYILLIGVLLSLIVPSCSNLDEEILDETTGQELLNDPGNIKNLVVPAYASLKDLWWRQSVWGLEEYCTDECMFPTRGIHWFDGGVFVEGHTHQWTATHRDISDTWDRLSTGVARANYSLNLLSQVTETSEIKYYKAELRFLRAFYSYYFMDLYGKVPFREYTETDYTKNPAILSRQQAFDFLVKELEEIMPNLGAKYEVPYGRPNKDAATMFLAKLYLNKGVYTGTPDWNKCKQYCDELINSGRYAIANDYFGIFSIENQLNYTNNGEAIFVTVYDDTEDTGDDSHYHWVHPTLHYNQTLGGFYAPWNGGIVMKEFFDKIDTANDIRYQDFRIKTSTGANLGFLIGQQFDLNGDSLKTNDNAFLNYTPECPLSGATERQGIRVMKYEPKVPCINPARVTNDYVVWRIADVYLMRAEAQFRINGGGLDDLNAIRTKRGLSGLASITEQALIDERGFELYWEGHRRQDLIRFGKFLEPMQDKEFVSAPEKQIYPIPQKALDAYNDKNLIDQNPGY